MEEEIARMHGLTLMPYARTDPYAVTLMPYARTDPYADPYARELIEAGLAHFEVELATLRQARKSDWRKGLLAAMIHAETTMKLDWISEHLHMGTRAGACRIAGETRQRLQKDRELRRSRDEIAGLSRSNE